jgi:hypothetical protein
LPNDHAAKIRQPGDRQLIRLAVIWNSCLPSRGGRNRRPAGAVSAIVEREPASSARDRETALRPFGHTSTLVGSEVILRRRRNGSESLQVFAKVTLSSGVGRESRKNSTAGPFSPSSEDDNRNFQLAALKCVRSGCMSDIADNANTAGAKGNRRAAAQSQGNPSLICPFSEALSRS